MTSSPLDVSHVGTRTRSQSTTYARARLWLGITSVGTIVVVASVLLLFDAAREAFGTYETNLTSTVIALASVLGLYVLFSLPFDVLGGYLLPRRFCRRHPVLATFAIQWLRGVLTQVTIMLVAAIAILWFGQTSGLLGATTSVLLMMLIVLAYQWPLARLIGGLKATRQASSMSNARQVDATDEGFSGGWTGLPGFERLFIPRQWSQMLTAEQLRVQHLRRQGVQLHGARTRGVVLAIAWNLVGFTLSGLAPGADVVTVAGLVNLALWFTLWSFVGLLILPSLSRPAVFGADAYALKQGVDAGVLTQTMRKLDALQDDEPRRPAGIETIFHPVPAIEHRLAKLNQSRPGQGAYHTARMALPLSWVAFGFLGRAVHCNCGRPELWVMLPSD